MAMEEGSSHAGDGSDDDDVPRLSSHALLALNDFLREQQQMNLMNNGSGEEGEQQQQGQGFAILREDWGMSQFWYDAPTARTLADEVLHLSESFGSNIACVACPSLYVQLKNSCPGMSVTLFEFDRRFARYGSDFTYYDYNYPQNLDDKFSHFFDIVVADPPYLSKECIEKMSQTLRFLSKDCERFPMLLLTGAMQQNHASRLLNVHPCGFRPVHYKKLGNEFKLYTNYDPLDRLGGWEHKATSSKD